MHIDPPESWRRAGHVEDAAAETDLQAELRAALTQGGSEDASASIDVLVRRNALRAFVTPTTGGGYEYTGDWRAVMDRLVALGSVDLNIARLFEGHLNALQLVALYGTTSQQGKVLAILGEGGMLGVWGADGAEPVRLTAAGHERWRLSGSKRYASGAGALRVAIVPVNETDGTMQLILMDVDEVSRTDLSSWNMRGMRRSMSGTYEFDGLDVTLNERIGEPDDYRREPYFVGGIWRCCAAQLGAIEAIVRAIAQELARTGRDAHPLQMARIGDAIIKARTARLWIEDAAARVEGTDPAAEPAVVAKAVALSAYGRLVTEEAAMAVIDLAERALGLGSFAVGHPAEALTRDLAVYIRQANPDAVLLQHGRILAADLLA